MKSTLVLNASYAPLSIVPARRAIQLILDDRVAFTDDSPEVFRSESLEIFVPYVVVRNTEVKVPYRHRRNPFSRRGVIVRDNYTCAYCEDQSKALTIDHVIPRALGGKTTYENCVAACRSCNSKKADKTLAELGWELHITPSVPSWYSLALNRVPKGDPQRESWVKYLSYYDPKLVSTAA